MDGRSQRHFNGSPRAGQDLAFEVLVVAEADGADEQVELTGHLVDEQLAIAAYALDQLFAVTCKQYKCLISVRSLLNSAGRRGSGRLLGAHFLRLSG